tara:strand:+ start:288 stop:2345 length:2058 start_codon:yes stop_codon:yes gene_type:complete
MKIHFNLNLKYVSMLMLLVSASAYAQKRTATVKVDYKSNRFMDPQDVNLVSHLGFLNENVNTYADDDKNIYLVEEFAKQVLYTYEDGKEDTIALGYSSGNEVRNAVAIAKWNENLTTKQYGLIHSEGEVVHPIVCFNEVLDRIFIAVTVYGDTLYPYLDKKALAIPTNRGSAESITMLLAYDFNLDYKSHQIYKYSNSNNIQLTTTPSGCRLIDELIWSTDSIHPVFTFAKPSRLEPTILMLDLNNNLQPLGDGYLVSGSFFREYESIDPDHTMISFGGRTRKGDTLRYRIKNLANNTEQQFATISPDNWTARGLILDLNHSTGQIDTIAQITSMRYKKWPTENPTYLVKKDFVQILSYFDSTVFINGEEIKDPDINAFNVLSYHLPTKSTFAIDLKNCSYSGGYFFNHSSVAGSVVDTFNFAFTSGEKFIAETRSNFNNASHVLSKYNPGNLNILWARSTTFPNVDILSTKIYQSTQNLTIYGEAVSPKQDLEPYIRENALTDVGKKLVVYNCTPISYFEAYPNEGFYVQFLNLSDRNATYKWHFTSRDSSTEINPRHKFGTVDGTYTITLIATNECGSDSFSRDIIIDRRNFINIKDQTLTSSISVFPNPTRYEHITISNSTNEGINEALLYDHYGRLVKSSIYDNQNSHTIAFETGNIPSGNYTLAVKTDENIFYKKVIVIK